MKVAGHDVHGGSDVSISPNIDYLNIYVPRIGFYIM
jgi:hypothetical protein